MDHLRVLLVPFHPTNLLMVGLFSLVMSFFLWAVAFLGAMGAIALIGLFILNIWVLKYCFVLVEHLADGAREPPVMEVEMLSNFGSRPMAQTAILLAGACLCWKVGGGGAVAIAVLMLLTFPAQVALLAMGDGIFRALNPVAWFRVIRGLGPMYFGLLATLAVAAGLTALVVRLQLWRVFQAATFLLCEVAFFGLIGSCIWLRRQQLGYEPSRSPERAAARAEAERLKERAKMVDDVFQLVRLGKHVDATAPLARWLNDTDAEHVSKDSHHVAEQALRWESLGALNTLGSTLIRHLMRYGRPDAALSVFEILRSRAPNFTMDSVSDLRTLAEFADSNGHEALAQSMRLETPVIHPKA